MRVSTSGLTSQPMEGERRSINSELWHACAGPRVSLPPIGSVVVYFPQGHSEQVAASTQKEVDGHIPNYPSLPSQLYCQLHNVTLHADLETDEVFAQMTLQPVNGQEKDPFMPPDLGTPNRQPTDFFCKTLTASDTSTHGGFSVPRRAAEKVFPPLDFSKQPPAQELHAKDLHDQIWTFRHIYRGQPKRHLLTTGWSVFVSAKRLVAGDAVLFIRDEKGQLLLGIRRANRQATIMPSSVLSSDSMHIGVLAAAAHAASTSSRFLVFYNPRASPSEFVIPLAKYHKAFYGTQVSVGMRFRMVFETEESTLRRYMGTITGIGDLDPVRWPNSQWRNLEVGWDESSAGDRPHRVSIWEIEPVSTPFLICPPTFALRPKRPRHLGFLGEDTDMNGNSKRCLTWLRGETSNMDMLSSSIQGLDADTWMRLQQRSEVPTPSVQPDFYQAMAAAVFQESRSADTSKQLLQPQAPQQMQFRLPQPQQALPQSQQPQQQEHQQQHLLWPQQSHPHHQHIFQHQQPPQQQKQSPPTPQQLPQQQQLTAQLPKQQQLQTPLPQLSQLQSSLAQHQPPLAQPQHQTIQVPDVSAHLLPSRPQPALNLPASVRGSSSSTPIPETDLPFVSTSATGNSFSLQSILGRSHPGALGSDDNGQLSNILRPPVLLQQQQQQQGGLLMTSTLSREAQANSAWFSSLREPNHAEASMLPSVPMMGQSDTSVTATSCSFSIPSEPPGQTGLASLPLHSSTFVFRESPQDEEVQPDLSNHLLRGVNMDSSLVVPSTTAPLHSRVIGMGKDIQGRAIGGNVLAGSFPSPSAAFPSPSLSFPSPSAPDVAMNAGVMVGGGLDEALLPRNCNWGQMPAPVRTFTKVKKWGSVGRSLDVSRFSNYGELRRALASMFNLEGQLEDPRSGWQLVFVDNEGDVLLVGDDPWEEFVSCVHFIKILPTAEVLQMSHDGLELLNPIPMQQQTSSSSGDCHGWKNTSDPSGGSLEH